MKYNFTSISKKVMDNFFKAIAKTGSLVSLDKFVVVEIRSEHGDLVSVTRKRSKLLQLSSLISKLGFRMFGACFTGKGKYSSRIRQLNAFRVHLYNMYRHHGSTYVVKYLKNSQLAIQKAIAGQPVSSLNEIDPSLMYPSLTAVGLPKFIPLRDRRLMLINGSASVIRWWLTLYALYRVISIPGTLKLNTITDPMSASVEIVSGVAEEITKVINPSMFRLDLLRGSARLLFIEKASPSNSVSWLGFISDVLALQATGQLDLLIKFLNLTGNFQMSRMLLYIYENLLNNLGRASINSELYFALTLGKESVGKLSIKEEAAGKRRVFAMVDVWTQSALRPLHDMLFAFLKTLPNDGTFDQNKSVLRCQAKATEMGQSFGYDLTAATDRLPILLQSRILNHLFPDLGDIWAEILTGRDYTLKGYGTFRYSTGQPMGALSSWAMLAVTHHYIAQLAAIRAANKSGTLTAFWSHGPSDLADSTLGEAWYRGYEVLGDDIVFFEKDTAAEYLVIMDQLGVPINLSKSVVATNATFEFAKVTGHKGRNVAAVSWAMFMSQPSIMGRAGIGYAMLSKSIVKTRVISFLTTLARQSKYTEGSPNVFFLALGTMYAKAGRLPFYDFLYSIMQKSAGYYNVYQTLLEKANIGTLQRAIVELTKTDGVVSVPNPLLKRVGYKADEFALKQTLITAINAFLHGSVVGSRTVLPVNPHKDAALTARAILVHPTMLLSLSTEQVLAVIDNKRVFSLDSRVLRNLSPWEGFLHHLFVFLFVQIYDKLIMIYAPLISATDLHGKSLEELMSMLDEIARYKEITSVLDRALLKLSGETQPDRNLIESPLKVLEMLLEADDPFGAEQTGYNPTVNHGLAAMQYMYALQRLENLPISDLVRLGESSPSDFYMGNYYSPLS